MNSSIEIISLGIGIAIGLIIGALTVFLIKGKKQENHSDETARWNQEQELFKLQTELKHLSKTLEEKNSSIMAKDQQRSEIANKLNDHARLLGIANERLHILNESNTKIEKKLEEQNFEISAKDRQIIETSSKANEAFKNLRVESERLQNFNDLNGELNRKLEEQRTEISDARQNLARITVQADALKINSDELRKQNSLKEVQNHELNKLYSDLQSSNATLLANLNASEGKLATQKAEIEDIRQKSHFEFESIANRLLDAKTEKFTESNRVNIQNLLEPLGKEINSFKNKVEETYNRESQERFSLGEKVKELIETTDKVSAEANNLAAALKGQAKTQGNWGEMILERILETNGLTRGREYDVQHPVKNSEGGQQFLDVIIHLPDNRKLIIDAKVTLVAYDRYCTSETDEDRARYLKEHIKSLSTHIDQLSNKKYDEMETSPDFVILFVPIEPAYLTAIQNDDEIWARAYSKRILLISPTNLMGAVRMVSDLWKRDQQSKNALEIARQGENLYDKFIGFLDSMDDIGSYLIKTQDSFNKALGQLKQGRGNLISRAEKLKDLGLKSSKVLPSSMKSYDSDFSEPSESLEIETTKFS